MQEVEGGEVKAESFIGFAFLQQLIQMLVLQHRLSQNGQLQNNGDQNLVENSGKFAIFSCKA